MAIKTSSLVGAGLILLSFIAASPETIYKCGEVYQNYACSDSRGKIVGKLPQVSRYTFVDDGTVDETARARYSWSGNDRPEHKSLPPALPQEILAGRLEALKFKMKEFADNVTQLTEIEGEQMTRGRLNRLRGELSSLCTSPTVYESLRKSESCDQAGEELMRAERALRGE